MAVLLIRYGDSSACPGQEFADSSIWLAVACMIATLDINEAVDAAGKRITPPAAFDEVFVR